MDPRRKPGPKPADVPDAYRRVLTVAMRIARPGTDLPSTPICKATGLSHTTVCNAREFWQARGEWLWTRPDKRAVWADARQHGGGGLRDPEGLTKGQRKTIDAARRLDEAGEPVTDTMVARESGQLVATVRRHRPELEARGLWPWRATTKAGGYVPTLQQIAAEADKIREESLARRRAQAFDNYRGPEVGAAAYRAGSFGSKRWNGASF
jgi:hypothetical protein